MCCKPRIFRLGAPGALAACLLLSGCETTELSAHLPPAPAAELGPAFELAHAPRYDSAIRGTMDSTGRAHLILAIKTGEHSEIKPGQSATKVNKIMEVRYVVIGPSGAESNTVVRSGISQPDSDPLQVDLAFDRAGALHALIGTEHLVLKNGAWTGGQRTPWQEIGITPRTARFVKGMPDLTWAFEVQNKELGLPDRTDRPAPEQAEPDVYTEYDPYYRMMVVPEETPYRHWYALGMEDELDTDLLELAADRQHAVHAFYAPSRHGGRLHYAVFRLDSCRDTGPDTWFNKRQIRPELGNGTAICPVLGSVTKEGTPPQSIGPRILVGSRKFALVSNSDYDTDLGLAMDPDTGSLLLTGGDLYSVLAGNAPRSQVAKIPAHNGGVITAAAGNTRFHALMTSITAFSSEPPLYYLAYANGAWSAPVEIGRYSYSYFSFLKQEPEQPGRDSFTIVSANDGRALLIWPYNDTLMARWVTLR